MASMSTRRLAALAVGLTMAGPAVGYGQGVPVPRPFPGSGPTQAPAPVDRTPPPAPAPTSSAPQAAAPPAPAASTPAPAPDAPVLPSSVPIYPSAEFLESFDAGSGQRYYLYGTNLPYAELVSYYRTVLKDGGRDIYKSPGMHQFDLGRYREDSMAYPPSIVIKDYASSDSAGYLFVSGTTEKRFRTIIQVVPPDPSQ
jgi:hypothetical protein